MLKYAVILSAGLGTRFLPYTKAIPKPMLPIIDTPTLEYIIKEAIECGIPNIIVVIGHNASVIEKHFQKMNNLNYDLLSKEIVEKLNFSDNVKITFTKQYILNGTAGAILSAKSIVGNNDFLVMNADELFVKENAFDKNASKQLIDLYERTGETIVGTQCIPKEDATRLGVVVGKRVEEKIIKLNKIVEKPSIAEIKEPIVNLGRYVVKGDIFSYLEKVNPNKNGEYALTDALVDYAKTHNVLCYEFVGKRYDIGNKFSFMKANFDFCINDKTFGKDFKDYVLNELKISN